MIEVEGIVGAPIEVVWRVVSDFANLRRWHPDVLSCRSSGTNGHVERIIRIASGSLVERLVECSEIDHIFAYRVTAGDFPEYLDMVGRIALLPQDMGTRICWTARFEGDPPEMERRMTAYYTDRIGHLRAAVSTQSIRDLQSTAKA